jgi:hypothetical protein
MKKVEKSARKVYPTRLIEGIGFSNSAMMGAKMVNPRAKKLQIPIAVALLATGNTVSLLKEPWYAFYTMMFIPILVKKPMYGMMTAR